MYIYNVYMHTHTYQVLLQVLAQLLVSHGDYQQALEMYLKLRLAEQVFGLISSYDLFSAVKHKVCVCERERECVCVCV
jgi:hypothetical protein